ncbi:RNA polymerase sigma-70 factor (ECF subfamily) [Armatimonas rosea]|uniref:RNA polymerase sigma-70 factor (ECF subfamily) n=1 Tax=Armatimonas rosea TaxID=685828 RepID=A0A7W9W8C6_ARMRO|nr:RNA polymerase sigma-70 factor (ECF subfamily) [Armatimonas rosea]
MYHYALRRLSSTQDAEDVAAEVYVVALETRWHPSLEPRPWLLGVARRKVADRLRLRLRRPEAPLQEAHELPCATASPEADALRAEAVATIRALVRALPELQREALLLQTAEELSVKEIAQVMGKSVSAVNSLLGRARETLRLKGGSYFQEDGR